MTPAVQPGTFAKGTKVTRRQVGHHMTVSPRPIVRASTGRLQWLHSGDVRLQSRLVIPSSRRMQIVVVADNLLRRRLRLVVQPVGVI